jgi:hypothetical protein
MPMSLLQEMIWNYRESLEDRSVLTHVRNYRVLGPVDIDIFGECLRG